MKSTLRKVLADSHVAPIAITLLLARCFNEVIFGSILPIAYSILGAITFLMTAIAEREFPLFSSSFGGSFLMRLSEGLFHLISAATCTAAAWLLSKWVYGLGPLPSLQIAWSERARRSNASSLEDGACR